MKERELSEKLSQLAGRVQRSGLIRKCQIIATKLGRRDESYGSNCRFDHYEYDNPQLGIRIKYECGPESYGRGEERRTHPSDHYTRDTSVEIRGPGLDRLLKQLRIERPTSGELAVFLAHSARSDEKKFLAILRKDGLVVYDKKPLHSSDPPFWAEIYDVTTFLPGEWQRTINVLYKEAQAPPPSRKRIPKKRNVSRERMEELKENFGIS